MGLKMKRAVFSLLLLLITSPGVAGRQAPLLQPPPIAVPLSQTSAETHRAILFALTSRGWAVESDEGARVVASYYLNKHNARIAADLNTDSATISILYLDSTNLNFEGEGDKREIHPAYNEWVTALHKEMTKKVIEGVPENAALPVVRGDVVLNPSPTERFSNFARFELADVAMGAPYVGHGANDDALRDIQPALRTRLDPILSEWNRHGTPEGRLLRIEPELVHIRFVGDTVRALAGRMIGASSIALRVRYVDTASGTVVAEPEFFIVSNSTTAYTMSGMDYRILEEAAIAATEYTRVNYAEAIGGGIRSTRARRQ